MVTDAKRDWGDWLAEWLADPKNPTDQLPALEAAFVAGWEMGRSDGYSEGYGDGYAPEDV